MGFAQITALVLQFASSVVLARLLTPYEMGIYAVSAATVGVLSVVQAFGLQALIVREEFLTAEISATAFTLNTFLALALSAGIASLSVAGGAFLHDTAVQHVLLILAISPLFSIFDLLPTANLERRGRFRTMSLVTTASGIVGTILTIVLAFKGFKYMSLVYSGVVSAALTTILMNIAGRQHVSFQMGLKAWRRVANFGLQMLAVSGVNSVSTRLSDVLLGRLQGLGPLGIYNRAGSLNGLIWSNVHLVAGRVVFVDYAELNRQNVSLRDRYLRTVEIITALLWPAFGGFAILSGPFILMVYGAKWLPATIPLAFLAVASMILVSITMTWELFAATGQLKAQTRIEFIRAGVALACFAAGCLISLAAAAAARVVDAAFAVFLYRKHLDRMTDTALSDFLPIYGQSAILTVLALIPPAILMITHHMSARTPMLQVIASVVLGIIFWAAGLAYFKHPLMQEARLSMQRFSRNRAAAPLHEDS
jgi:O-antigen/teichoic acid export membrane protein